MRFSWVLFSVGLICVCTGQSLISYTQSVFAGPLVAKFSGMLQDSAQNMATDANGNIYVSGTTWSPDFPVKNAAQPRMGDRIMRSADRGATWTALADPLVAAPLTIQPSPSTPTTLFAGGVGGIAKSTDGGQTWRLVYSQPNTDPDPKRQFGALSIAIMPENPSRVLAVISPAVTSSATKTGGLVASDDSGETWAPVTGIPTPTGSGPFPGGFRELIVDPNGSGTTLLLSNLIFISRDEGRTWKISGPGGLAALSAAFDPFRSGWIYASVPTAGFDGPIFLSTNYGQSWTSKVEPAGRAPVSSAVSLLVDPEQLNRLYAATQNGVYISRDGAASWAPSQQNVIGPNKGLALLPRGCSGGGLFGINAAGGVARSLDFTSSWQSTQFGYVAAVATGPGCGLYAARNLISDAFVTKLGPGGTEVLWSTFLGAGSESADAMAVDPSGNVYVAGRTRSNEFPATSPRMGPDRGFWDVFVTKYDPTGQIVYSIILPVGPSPEVAGLAGDRQGNAYVVGTMPTVAVQAGVAGFIVKLTPGGNVAYSSNVGSHGETPTSVAVDQMGQALVAGLTFLPTSGLPVTPGALQIAPGRGFLLRLDPTGSTITYASYVGGTDDPSYDRSGVFTLATDSEGNVYAAGITAAGDFPLTPGAYFSSRRSRPCIEADFHNSFLNSREGDLFVLKLRSTDLQLMYSALLGGECRAVPVALAIGSRGEAGLSVRAGLGFPLRSPLAGAPIRNRGFYPGYPNQVAAGSSIAVLSASGSSLTWSSYLDSSVPAVAFAPDGSLYAAVNSGALDGTIGHGSVWRVPLRSQDVSIDSVANAFSCFSDAIAPGSLVALTGTNLSSDVIDLGLNPAQELPTELGGVRVSFDGVPAHILQIGPSRIICVAPLEIQDRTVLQLTSAAGMSNAVVMPVNSTAPGLLIRSFPEVAAFGRDMNGVVRNEDGGVNDADHPAARGSTVSLYATGLGVTTGSGEAGRIATTDTITPAAPFYAWWSSSATSLRAPATTVPGFVTAIFQVKAPVPMSGLNDGSLQRLTVALESFVQVDAHMNSVGLPSPADQVVVYVK